MTEPALGEALLRLSGIAFRRNGKTILEGVALSVCAGEIVTLIGPNGAGKSTLVKIALNLMRADGGAARRRPGLRVGYVPQKIDFDPTLPLTVRRFLHLAQTHSPDRPTPKQDLAGALAQAGASEPTLGDAPLHSISGGEMRRVLLARALLRDPNLLILDEPAAGMDINGQAELYRLVQRIRDRRRCGILLVSHDLYMVMAATDRVFCLNRHLCCSGRPEAVRRHPQFRALFGEQAASELAVYHHHHDHKHDLHGDIQTHGAADGDAGVSGGDGGDGALAVDGDAGVSGGDVDSGALAADGDAGVSGDDADSGALAADADSEASRHG